MSDPLDDSARMILAREYARDDMHAMASKVRNRQAAGSAQPSIDRSLRAIKAALRVAA